MQNKLDPRWTSWAQGVREGATLAQRKWSGKNRPFTRSEYEDGIRRLDAIGVLIFLEKLGYHPWRGRGWDYISRMARGEVGIPPPPQGTTSPRVRSTVRRARKAAHSQKHTILRREREQKMKTRMVHQSKAKTIFYLYNDLGQCVARLEKPGMITQDQQQEYAKAYRKAHPQEFPGENDKDLPFVFGGKDE